MMMSFHSDTVRIDVIGNSATPTTTVHAAHRGAPVRIARSAT